MTDYTELKDNLRKADAEDEVRGDPSGWGVSIYFEAAEAIEDLEARLRIAEKRAEDAEGRDDFLMEILHMSPEELKELRELIEQRKGK